MQLGMIGLGRMGGNMARRLLAAGHEVIVYAATAQTRETFAQETGVFAASSLAELAARLSPPGWSGSWYLPGWWIKPCSI